MVGLSEQALGQGHGGARPDCALPQVIPSTSDSQHLFKILLNGSIILNGSLSYNNKSAFYQLELKACVSGVQAQAQVGGHWDCGPAHEAHLPSGLGRLVPKQLHQPVLFTCLPVNLGDRPAGPGPPVCQRVILSLRG